MTMKSKFAGKCSVCGARISKGATIEWARNTGAMHVECATGEDHLTTFEGKVQPVRYTTAAMREDEENYEAFAGEAFMTGLR